MLNRYKTFGQSGQGEIVEKKSRFIASAEAVSDEDDAYRFINSVKKQHVNAGHNVFAFRLPKLERYSDDGEPSQTAGPPVLELMRGHEIINGVIVVTRYFGGTLLGTGGLVRAYQKAAGEAISAAGIVEKRLFTFISIKTDYSLSGKIQHFLASSGAFTDNILYTDIVEFHVCTDILEKDRLISQITDLTAARGEISEKGQGFCALSEGKLIKYSY